MCMKIKIVIENQGVDRLLVYTENKGLITIFVGGLPKSGEQKMMAYPTMLMKTKETRNDKLDDPTMFIKTNNLVF